MSIFKYFFYTLLFALLMNCGSGGGQRYYPTTPSPHTNTTTQQGQCYYALMTVEDANQYELFLSEAPPLPFCGKTGGSWFVNKQVYAGNSACKNWTASPSIEISFDLQFTRIQKLQINPRGSGGYWTGNRGTSNFPVIFPANSVLAPQNRDKGWSVRIPPANSMRGGIIELYCDYCDFSKNKDMSVTVKYRERPLGSFKINPKDTIARCQQSTTNATTHVHTR